MTHLPPLITDLALMLGAAGITTLLFRRLKQPVVLGYVLCGLLVGPNVNLFPTVSDVEGIKVWAEIGVIVLLFTLGLEFSFKKLVKVGPAAVITGTVEISAMLAMGYAAGRWLGWSWMDSLFLGGIIAISSTTIIFRAFEELGLKTRQFTSLVMGVLIIEDVVAVVLMVLLSTMAASQAFAGTDLLMAIGKLLFFLSLWFLLGIFLLPGLLRKAARWLNSETLLIAALGLCLGTVVFAHSLGLSAALGAFVMGSILSETAYGEKIEHLLVPVKNLFGAVFFVSVGMLIDPQLLLANAGSVLLIAALVVGGKLLFVSGGALLAGRPLRQAVQAGTSMTQIGEFSFIIATLGVSMNVIDAALYPIAVGVSVLTTFTTPLMIKSAEGLIAALNKRLPARWLAAIDNYSAGSQLIKAESDWRLVVRHYAQVMAVNTVMMVAVILLSRYVLTPQLKALMQNEAWARALSLFISVALMLPFAWAMIARKMQHHAYKALWLDSKYNHGPLVTLEIVRSLLAVGLMGLLLRQYFSTSAAVGATLLILIVVLFVFRQRLQHFYQRIEQRFLHNLQGDKPAAKGSELPLLAPWDAHLSKVRIGPGSHLVGIPLEELALREKYGINVAFIERGNRLIYAPARTEKLFPYDEIGVIGTDAQLQHFAMLVEGGADDEGTPVDLQSGEIILQKLVVDAHNGLTGQTIRQSGIREKTNGLVVGIERKGERMLNPSSDTRFEWEDIVWLVGERSKIARHYFQQGGAKA